MACEGLVDRASAVRPGSASSFAGRGRYELATAAKAGETLTLTQPFPVSFDPAILTGRRRRA
uniref:Uncharacterized protein n=1 Tax=Nonomuraea gerenzanensis TaxID=93944 RepID=A0A1M4E9B3_9ACTN|nr:hypothetical protein BN4615_P4868 [Nonomuraea gerenzanensis]